MLKMSSFKAYGKLDDLEHAKLEARRRIAVISISSVILVAVIVAATVGTAASRKGSGSGGDQKQGQVASSTSVRAVCDLTLYPESCYSSLNPLVANSTNISPEDLLRLSIAVALKELSLTTKRFDAVNNTTVNYINSTTYSGNALENCRQLLALALDHLNSSLSSSGESLNDAIEDLRTWLSAARTYYDTCLEGFDDVNDNGPLKTTVGDHLKNSTELTSNSLAIVTWVSKVVGSLKLRRRLMSYGDDDRPEWLSHDDHRKLLQNSDGLRKKADIVVAQNGSYVGGKKPYKTISAALKAVPEKSKKRTVIYVTKGVYSENVRVEKSKWNVLMVGDGKDATIVTGSLNFVDGTPTFSTATFAVFGKNFIGREMGFRNTAGAKKHQAVALMASADQVVFYRCRIEAFQDSLYTHSNRQFYRECDIYGTVDFIFGNAAAVLQNCNILPRVPMPGQQNTITAQGKTDPNQNTGISIHNSTIWPSGNLSSVRTYLGRPWKNYSTTVYLRSYIDSFIDPTGWLPWTGNSAPDTIFYSEYENFGPGSNTRNRVNWKGLRNISRKEATKFSTTSFLQGNKWIPDTDVPHKPSI